MKKYLYLSLIIACMGCGSEEDSLYPDVAGNYERTAVSEFCGSYFDHEIIVHQNENEIYLEATHQGYYDAQGVIQEDGDFSISSEDAELSCSGQFTGNSGTANCTVGDIVCQVTYTKM